MRTGFTSVAILAAGVLAGGHALADDVAAFYQGKAITLTVSGSAGGGYDTLARVTARFLGRHVPGHPVVIVRNMAGAGGIAAANFLASGAPADGSHIGLLANDVPFAPLLGLRETRFDATRFHWLGSPSVDTGLLITWHATGVASLDDARAREVTVGAAGETSTAAFHARLLNAVLGTRLKIVNGYPGQGEAFYAMERGELDGHASVLRATLDVTRPDWLPQQRVTVLLTYGPEKPLDLSARGAAHAPEVVRDENKLLLDAATAPLALGRPFAMPPGVPAERVAVLRRALTATFADPQFQAESRRLALDPVSPRSADALVAVIAQTYAAPAPVVERLRSLARPR